MASGLVSRDRESSAIAMVFLGLTVALVTGVPLGTWISQSFGWQATFLGVVLLGVIGLIASAVLVPSNLPQSASPSLRAQARVLTSPRLLLVYLITALGYGGNFIAFTYLAPMLTDVTGLSAGAVSLVILLYGASVAVGNILGGRLADRMGPVPALTLIFAGLAVLLAAFGLALPHPVAAVAVVALWGGFAFANVPPLQAYVVQIARQVSPDAVDVASGLNIGAFNLGIALGRPWAGRGRQFGPHRRTLHRRAHCCSEHWPHSAVRPAGRADQGHCCGLKRSKPVCQNRQTGPSGRDEV
ncbi:MFS transporter [Paracoccus marcusii]|uniref:MFS transporter n=1 Tax=Paracoccus marcusii TaxID=59779 RepID=UPI002ED50670|nr:MFS transporter [Paracoccus marcusii]